MVDWTQPTVTTVYTQVLTDLDDRLDECAIMFDGTTSTNIPTGAIRIDTSDLNKLERYGGATWDAMDLRITGALTVQTEIFMGTGGVGALADIQMNGNDDGVLRIGGGSEVNTGGNIFMYGATAASFPGTILLRDATTTMLTLRGGTHLATFAGDILAENSVNTNIEALGGTGFASFTATGGANNRSYVLFGNETTGDLGRITATADKRLWFGTNGETLCLILDENQDAELRGDFSCTGSMTVGQAANGAAVLEVRDNATAKTRLFGILADDEGAWHMCIQNSMYSTNLSLGMRFQVGSAGSSSIYAADDGVTPGNLVLRTDAVARLTLSGTSHLATWGSGATTFGHARGGSTSTMWFSGGTAQNSGSALTLNGPTTTTVGNDWGFSSGGTDNLYWDNSAGLLTVTGDVHVDGARLSVGSTAPLDTHLSTLETIEVGIQTVLYGANNTGGSHFMRGAYHNGTNWVKTVTGEEVSALSFIGTGNIKLRTATSGTAGDTVSWIDSLEVDNATGDLTMTGALLTSASTTTRAGMNIPEGTAPTTPTDGDVWVTTTDILARINGVSETLLSSLGPNSVGQSELASNAVAQTHLDDAVQSGTVRNTHFIATGGQFCLSGTIDGDTGTTTHLYQGNPAAADPGGQTAQWYWASTAAGEDDWNLRYIATSPPYDLGDGEIPLFVYAQIINATGEIRDLSVSPDPIWMYNGPTDTTPAGYRKNGTTYRMRRDMSAFPMSIAEAVALGDAAVEDYTNAFAAADMFEEDITQEIKNRDQHIVPHVFPPMAGHTLVLLDPVSDIFVKLFELRQEHDGGEKEVNHIIKHRMKYGNSHLNRKGPNGLLIPSIKWKHHS